MIATPGGVWSVTGHRPEKFGGYDSYTFAALVATARMAVTWAQPSMVLVGVALGWDMAVACACVELRVPFVACVPFEGQEVRWRREQQELYQELLGASQQVVYVSPPPYSPQKMQIRNRYMVDYSEKVMAAWSGDRHGGTFNCVEYALSRRPVVNWWGRFGELRSGNISCWPWQSNRFPMDIPF